MYSFISPDATKYNQITFNADVSTGKAIAPDTVSPVEVNPLYIVIDVGNTTFQTFGIVNERTHKTIVFSSDVTDVFKNKQIIINFDGKFNMTVDGIDMTSQIVSVNALKEFKVQAGDILYASPSNAAILTSFNISGNVLQGDDAVPDIENGQMLFSDPTFWESANNLVAYNTLSPAESPVAVERETSASYGNLPTTSPYYMLFTCINGTTGVDVAPGYGGFKQVVQAEAGRRYIHKIIASISPGARIRAVADDIGDTGTVTWLTSQEGTGLFETYMYEIQCSNTGTFGDIGVVYFDASEGVAPPASVLIGVPVIYATVLDMTGVPDIIIDLAQATALKTTFNGRTLDTHSFDGTFKTLNVSGRGLLAPVNVTTTRIAAPGAWLDSSELPPRIIEVEALVTAENEVALRSTFIQLNWLLNQGTQELIFSDFPNYYYKAILNSVSIQKEDKRQIIMTIGFLCVDPFAYNTRILIVDDKITPSQILFPVIPSFIRCARTTTMNGLTITNDRSGKKIKLNGTYPTGTNVEIFIDDGGITVQKSVYDAGTDTTANTSILTDLDLTSDIETFDLVAGDTITTTPASATCLMYLRERIL